MWPRPILCARETVAHALNQAQWKLGMLPRTISEATLISLEPQTYHMMFVCTTLLWLGSLLLMRRSPLPQSRPRQRCQLAPTAKLHRFILSHSSKSSATRRGEWYKVSARHQFLKQQSKYIAGIQRILSDNMLRYGCQPCATTLSKFS